MLSGQNRDSARRCFWHGPFLLLFGLCTSTFAADEPTAPAAKPAAATEKSDKPAAEKADDKTDAPKHAAGHSTDPTLVFKTVRVTALRAGTNEPLPETKVKARYNWKNKSYQAMYTTDDQGVVDVEVPTNRGIYSVSIESHPEKLTPVYHQWESRNREITPPAELKLQFEPAANIGGMVQDEAGKPIAKAKVQLSLPATSRENGNLVFTVATPTTDAQGRWQCDTAPVDLQNLSVYVTHPDYLQNSLSAAQQEKALHDLTAVVLLKQGLKVVGHVTDEQGQPIFGAEAQFGERFGSGNPTAKTDREGNFTLKNCKAGSTTVTVAAKGFAPEIQNIVVEDPPTAEPISFKFKPGSKISGRVVDVDGKPIKGVWIVSDTWRGQRSLKWEVHTDAEGKFESDSAPPDPMQCEILANGYLAIRGHVLQAQEQPYELVVHPVVAIKGSITDAETGKPIANFQLIPGIIWDGRSETYWQRDSAMQFTAGKYERHYSEPEAQSQLQVEAEGYQPAFSEPFKLADGSRTIDFKLSKADSPFEGNVTNAKDGPVEGADVVMLGPGSQLSFRDGLYDRRQNRNNPHAVSDKNGHFKLPNMEPPYLVIATHPKEGYAEIFTDQTTDHFEVKLIPWARIEGQLMIGDKPAADQSVTFQRLRESSNLQLPLPKLVLNNPAAIAQLLHPNGGVPALGNNPNAPQGQVVDLQREVQTAINNQLRMFMNDMVQVKTDAQGKFTFEHVIPGRVAAMREIVVQHGQFWTNTPCYGVLVDLAPGETGKVIIGGTGRPVIGHVDMPLFEGKKFDWSASDAIEVGPDRNQNFARAEGEWYTQRFCAAIGRDGSFRLDDIPPGDYTFTLRINKPGGNPGNPMGQQMGVASAKFTIPEFEGGATRNAEPLDLGELKPQINAPAGGGAQ